MDLALEELFIHVTLRAKLVQCAQIHWYREMSLHLLYM